MPRRMWYNEFGEHSNSCRVEGCHNDIEKNNQWRRLCSQHENNHYDCKESSCHRSISSSWGYCSQHENICRWCSQRVGKYENYCNSHSKKCSECSQTISYQETYCPYHKENCHYGSYRCQQRVSRRGEYCQHHLNCCKFESCSERIPQYGGNGGYCYNHSFEEQTKIYKARWESERNRANNLQNQLNTTSSQLTNKQQENIWLQEQLKMYMGEDEYQAHIEINYPPNFKK